MIDKALQFIPEWAIPTLCCGICTFLVAAVKGYRKQLAALNSGVKSLLRAEIIRSYEKYTDRGFCPIYAREPLTRAYEAYHALGGNSTATDLYKRTLSLPPESSDAHGSPARTRG